MPDLPETSGPISAVKHSKLLSCIDDVIVVFDEKGNITYNSPNVERIFGWNSLELVGTNAPEIIHSDDLDAAKQFFKSLLLEPNASDSIELRYKCKEGSYKWILFRGTNLLHDEDIAGVLGNYHEISDRKKAQDAIYESEARFKALFHNLTNSSSVYEVVTDDNGEPVDYRFLTVNTAYEKTIGLKEDQLIGKTLLEVFPTTEQVWMDTLKEVFLTGSPIQVEDYSQEIDRYFELIVYRVDDSQIAMIGSDITDRKNNEIEIIKAKEKAEENDQLKTAFLQNISHEIRTPLNAICGFANFLNDPGLSDEQRTHFISIINNNSSQLLSILEDILTISSLESRQVRIKLEEFSINKVLNELHDVYMLQSSKKNLSIIVTMALPDKKSNIKCDKLKITHILSNLLNNAVKFTSEGYIEFGYNLKNDFIEFFVKDSGIGIPSDFSEKIFEHFRQADHSLNRPYGGAGLGLSISKGYVELLGGKIWVESELDKGSSFFFTVPHNIAGELDQSHDNLKMFNGNGRTILIAEDEGINFLYIQEILKVRNIHTIHAKDGIEALNIYKSNPNIDLILMDIKMPRLDGYSVAKKIKESNPEIPIIAQTAYALKKDIERFKDVFDDYITKPIKSETLSNIIYRYFQE